MYVVRHVCIFSHTSCGGILPYFLLHMHFCFLHLEAHHSGVSICVWCKEWILEQLSKCSKVLAIHGRHTGIYHGCNFSQSLTI